MRDEATRAPARVSVNRDAGIAEVELASMASGGALAIEQREDLALDLDGLRQVLLHPVAHRRAHRLDARARSRCARRPRGVVDEPVRLLLVETRRDECLARRRELRRVAVGEAHRAIRRARTPSPRRGRSGRRRSTAIVLSISSHPQNTAPQVEIFAQLRGRAFVDDAAALQHIGAIASASTRSRLCSTMTIATSLAQLVEGLEQFLDDRRCSPSNGSSSSSTRTWPDSARATATICCSPPDRKSAGVSSRRSELREELENPVRRSTRPRAHFRV